MLTRLTVANVSGRLADYFQAGHTARASINGLSFGSKGCQTPQPNQTARTAWLSGRHRVRDHAEITPPSKDAAISGTQWGLS